MNSITNGFYICKGAEFNYEKAEHSLTDLGLAIKNTNCIGEPSVETFTVDVPGGLPIDLSEALTGEPVYKGRTITIELGGIRCQNEWDKTISRLRTKYHGQICSICFDNYDEYFFTGRTYIRDFDRTRNLGTFTIVMDAKPYAYSTTEEQIIRTKTGDVDTWAEYPHVVYRIEETDPIVLPVDAEIHSPLLFSYIADNHYLMELYNDPQLQDFYGWWDSPSFIKSGNLRVVYTDTNGTEYTYLVPKNNKDFEVPQLFTDTEGELKLYYTIRHLPNTGSIVAEGIGETKYIKSAYTHFDQTLKVSYRKRVL